MSEAECAAAVHALAALILARRLDPECGKSERVVDAGHDRTGYSTPDQSRVQ